MILTGPEILKEMKAGRIVIDPFDEKMLNPNSVNLRLGKDLLVYDMGPLGDRVLDMAEENQVGELTIPAAGLVLHPGTLYLGHTLEYTETYGLVPCIEGRSSVGRLGVQIHITAGWGETSFCGTWTCEISVVHPIRVYAGTAVCQICYYDVRGEVMPYQGKYQGQRKPKPSGLWKEFQTKP